MSIEQVNNYFIQHAGQRICGHFKAAQVEVKRPLIHRQLIKTYEFLEQSITVHFLRAISLSLITLCMTVVGCQTHTEGEKIPKDSSNQSEFNTKHDSVYAKDTVTLDGEAFIPEAQTKKTK